MLALVGASAGIVVAQEAARPKAPPTFGVTSSSVLVDVVVRDKKGNLVQDLTPADFEIYEDGVRQRVDGFALIGSKVPVVAERVKETAAPPPAAAPPVAPLAAPPQEHAVVALVFDKLRPEARKLAHDAAISFVENGRKEGDVVGVFLLDLKLHLVQDFTPSGEAVRAAVEQVGRSVSLPSSGDAGERRLSASDRLTDLNMKVLASGGTTGEADPAAAQAAGAVASDAALTRISLRMEETFDSLERDQYGYASVNGLLAIVNALRILPGRKTVVFFSEGLVIPARVEDRFRGVIDSANRSNVSVYTMDAAGLRTTSGQQVIRRDMDAAAALRRAEDPNNPNADPGRPMTQSLERAEDGLRSDPNSGLGTLAEQTGGFLIRDTNDLRAGFRRISEEMRFYYMLSYAPTNETFDGSFREISVKLKRSGLNVQARKGYFAVRSQGPVLSYEAPALALLERSAKADAFPVRAAALSFPDPKRPGLVSVLVEIPGTVPTYAFEEERKAYRADLVVLAQISDGSGNVVDKLSQRYQPSVPETGLEAIKQSPVLFYRETHLPKGHYVLDAVAYDNSTSKASLRSLPFDVPSPDNGHLQLGSLVTIGRFEQLPKEEIDSSRPLQYGEIQLYPSLGLPVKKSAQRALVFLVTAWTTPGNPVTRATAEVWQGGQAVKQAALEVPGPEPNGRIQALGQFPLDTFKPGEYELHVLVEDGRSTQVRSAGFRLEE
jgi:VWFA-related protein